MWPQADLAFVRGGEVEDREKRLAVRRPRSSGPGCSIRPTPDLRLHVVIFLGVVRAVVAGLAQVLREQADGIRQRDEAAHVLCAELVGYMPVMIAVRAGAQTGAFDQALR